MFYVEFWMRGGDITVERWEGHPVPSKLQILHFGLGLTWINSGSADCSLREMVTSSVWRLSHRRSHVTEKCNEGEQVSDKEDDDEQVITGRHKQQNQRHKMQNWFHQLHVVGYVHEYICVKSCLTLVVRLRVKSPQQGRIKAQAN